MAQDGNIYIYNLHTDRDTYRPRHITHPNIDRDEQISKLQHQINDLRNQRNSSNNSIIPKNLNPAPPSGAGTTEDIVKLINSTMLTLTSFASRLENPDLLQNPRECSQPHKTLLQYTRIQPTWKKLKLLSNTRKL